MHKDGKPAPTRATGRAALVLAVASSVALSGASLPLMAEEGVRTERVTVAIDGWENNLTPYGITFQSGASFELIQLVHDSLFWSAHTDDPEPWLAESADPNDDDTVWTIHLREGVEWHDGESLTAEDVAFTYDYMFDNNAPRYSHHINVLPLYERSEVIDDHTLEMHFEDPVPAFEIMPAADLPILPEHIWSEVDQPRAALDQLPVGSGPYKLVEMVSDERYVLEANQDYFQGAPLVDEIVLPIVRDSSAAFSALRTGEIDSLVRPVPPELIDDLQDDTDTEMVQVQRYAGNQLYFQTLQEPTSDTALRRAVALAVDREALVDRILRGHGQAGRDGFIHPDSYLAHPQDDTTFDPDAARELLDEAGYEQGPDGARRAPDGEPVSLSVLANSFNPLELRSAELVAEHLGEVGLPVEVEALDPSTLRERKDGGDWDLAMGDLDAHAHAEPDALYHFFGPGITGLSFGGYENAEFNELMEEAAVTADWEERLALVHRQQEVFADEVPALMLFYPDEFNAYRPATYDGWIADPGHMIFTKRSFLSERAQATDTTDTADTADTAGAPAAADTVPWSTIVIALVVVVAGGWLLLARRRKAEEDE